MNSQTTDDELANSLENTHLEDESDNKCRCGVEQCDCERRGVGFEEDDYKEDTTTSTKKVKQTDEQEFYNLIETMLENDSMNHLPYSHFKDLIKENNHYKALTEKFLNDDVNDYRSYRNCSNCGKRLQKKGMNAHQLTKECLRLSLVNQKLDARIVKQRLIEFDEKKAKENELKTPKKGRKSTDAKPTPDNK